MASEKDIKQLLDGVAGLGLTEIIQVQNELSKLLRQRFGVPRALVFTDVVGSTHYFQTHGDEDGRRLLQRHNDLVATSVTAHGGRVVDTAGDGAFSCFEHAEEAIEALIDLHEAIARENAGFSREHQLRVRTGFHWGTVLTDGTLVTGDAVNVCARVADVAGGAEIVLTGGAFDELTSEHRVRCMPLPQARLKGVEREIKLLRFQWRVAGRFPAFIRIEETEETLPLPQDRDLIRFGRLREVGGQPANDIVLSLPDPLHTRVISRWHFELRRLPEGFQLRHLSRGALEVNGEAVATGADVPIAAGTRVCVAEVLNIVFSSPPSESQDLTATLRLSD